MELRAGREMAQASLQRENFSVGCAALRRFDFEIFLLPASLMKAETN